MLCLISIRAPILIAIALIEEGMDPLESVEFIRKRRQGAINNKQLKYIENYKKRKKREGQIACCSSQAENIVESFVEEVKEVKEEIIEEVKEDLGKF